MSLLFSVQVCAVILCAIVANQCAYGANILFISVVGSPSHHIWNRALAFGLVSKGHNVTLIGPNEDKGPLPENYTSIFLEGFYKDDGHDMNEFAKLTTFQMIDTYNEYSRYHCDSLLKTSGLRQLLDYPTDFTFDLILVDITYGTCFYPLIQRFEYPPTVAVTAFLLPTFISYNFGNHLHPSYIPWYGVPYTDRMSFIERVWNFIYTNYEIELRNTIEYDNQDSIARGIFGNSMDSWRKTERHMSLLLANIDPVLGYPQPVPPNIIPVGGLHTRNSNKLPDDLQKLLDNARHGVILFSLGTNIRSDRLHPHQQKELLAAFSQLKQLVVWKFESENRNLPKNVVVRKWLPQNDVLGHPNVKLFMGHGGALSTQEAIFHGVPMVAIPFIVDQHINTKMVIKRKLGVQIDHKKITTSYVLKQIREVLNNPTYANNMKMVSTRFRDRPETPLERGIFWVEYVLRHGTGDFLATPARDMSFFTSSGMDVTLFLLLALLFITSLVCRLLSVVLIYFRGNTSKEKLN